MCDFGLTEWVEAEWRQVAKLACDKNDTMGNMGRVITEEEVYDAMLAANSWRSVTTIKRCVRADWLHGLQPVRFRFGHALQAR